MDGGEVARPDQSLNLNDRSFAEKPGSKYHKKIAPGVVVDVYDVLSAFDVPCPARQHAIKKLLMAGARGHKDEVTDLIEARDALDRAIELAV